MKLETGIVATKGFCLTTGAMAAALGAGLTQIDMLTLFGVTMKFWCLMCGVYAVGCNTLYGYLSQGVSNYRDQMKVDANKAALAAAVVANTPAA